jgi:hypothetical protein
MGKMSEPTPRMVCSVMRMSDKLEPISKSIFDDLAASEASACSDQATKKGRISWDIVEAASGRRAPRISPYAVQSILR